ncbi:threonine/homoserine/homoserine lactone efflux protein [Sinobacterium caligoides]|uniref:Threonine/homoserine/homoserine lactone efflux protein n=2 Tax=Sinobacterium caligoides TaxID=933926 RepID=A0A3N2DK52_9GAMM|nr:threonine/homoserine/homoserine lactone efflux protein [Sinobacterium caligoides]
MDLTSLLTFVLVALLLVISPGPSSLLIAKTVPKSGVSAGFAIVVGFLVALIIHGSLSIFGLSLILLQSPNAFLLMKVLGAMYLCWVGVKSLLSVWWSGSRVSSLAAAPQKASVTLRGAFIEGFLTNMLNPKVSMFYLAAFPQFLSINDSVYRAYLLVLSHAIISVFWFTALVIVVHKLKELAVDGWFSRGIQSAIGITFIGFAVKLVLFSP